MILFAEVGFFAFKPKTKCIAREKKSWVCPHPCFFSFPKRRPHPYPSNSPWSKSSPPRLSTKSSTPKTFFQPRPRNRRPPPHSQDTRDDIRRVSPRSGRGLRNRQPPKDLAVSHAGRRSADDHREVGLLMIIRDRRRCRPANVCVIMRTAAAIFCHFTDLLYFSGPTTTETNNRKHQSRSTVS